MHLERAASIFVLAIAVALGFVPKAALASSAFGFNDQGRMIVAKNYDWLPTHGHGALFVNKRGVAKQAQTLRTPNAAEWVSRHASVTFSQMGIDFPWSGMNEAGLVVELLRLKDTEHGSEKDPRPAVNETQWIQYQLDNFSTVAEVLENADRLRVEQAFLDVHYLVCDRTGECGNVAYLKGRLVTHSGPAFDPFLVTNSPVSDTLDYWNGREPRPESGAISDSFEERESFFRWLKAADWLDSREQSELEAMDFAFDLLSKIEMGSVHRTQWALVYDTSKLEVRFRTRGRAAIKIYALAGMDLECASGARMLDMEQDEGGPVTERLLPFDPVANKNLIDQNWMLMGFGLRRLAASYPSAKTRCLSPVAQR